MRSLTSTLSFWFFVSTLLITQQHCEGFSSRAIGATTSWHSEVVKGTNLRHFKHAKSSVPTSLFQSKGESQVDGTGRGLALFSVVLAVCTWLFSIPPEFRRAHFCFVEQCVQERSNCYDCVTFSEWTAGVQEYYRSGGGIEFDFTVADETKALWRNAVSK
jgi:hypothetical protein